MYLNASGLKNSTAWEKAGFILPRFDREEMIRISRSAPQWVHFGGGNLFRAFPAVLAQKLLDAGLMKTGIAVAAAYDGEMIDRVYDAHDNLSVAVTLKADGSIEKRVIASVAEALRLDRREHLERMKEIFRSPGLKMASFTITEKTYSSAPYMSLVAELLHERYRAGAFSIAMVSMDNCSHNGDRLLRGLENRAAVFEKGFLRWIQDPRNVSFPWTMIDKITPRADESVRVMLQEAGLEDTVPSLTARGSLASPFVNAEETGYLVIEDSFPAGRPPLEEAGVYFCSRDTVDKVEKMKVCTCLNPLHTALAIFGCLLGYKRISDEMKNPDLVRLIKRIGYDEGLPAASDPGIISPGAFIDEVVERRLPNPFIPDTPQRIAADSSQKIPIRFGETIKAYGARKMDTERLTGIPLVLAAWIRYLLGIDDEGNRFSPSPDPCLDELTHRLEGLKPGQKGPFASKIRPILEDKRFFAVNLYEAGLGEKIETFFEELMAGPGAVAAALKRHCNP